MSTFRSTFRSTSRRTPILFAALALSAATLGLAPTIADASHGGARATYRVTIENVATGSQPLSPAGVVVHSGRADVFDLGAPATAAVAAVAEDANLPVFVSTLGQARGVVDAFVGGAAPIAPGGSTTFEVVARPGARLSLVSMLVNTNDAFTGLDSVRLGNKTKVYEVSAYDAGTEKNDELAAHIPGPAGGNPFVRNPEGELITHHQGILGAGDLDPAVYDWDGPVARITVQRIG